jgi:competence protein ComEC
MQVLDVGQGLAIVVETRSRRLLYDTGPAFRTGGTIAEFVILPYLWHRGIHALDKLVVSHADLDHAGGVPVMQRHGPSVDVLSGEPLDPPSVRDRACVAGEAWQWDGIDFVVLHPRAGSPWTGNNASCVVEVSAGNHRILLSGDIEAPVERLLEYRSALRQSRVVIVPHHGSRTSSSASLVATTSADVAIVSAAHANRWGFPKSDVVDRWRRSGARVLSTANSGAVAATLCRDGTLTLREHRREWRRYWHDVRAATP